MQQKTFKSFFLFPLSLLDEKLKQLHFQSEERIFPTSYTKWDLVGSKSPKEIVFRIVTPNECCHACPRCLNGNSCEINRFRQIDSVSHTLQSSYQVWISEELVSIPWAAYGPFNSDFPLSITVRMSDERIIIDIIVHSSDARYQTRLFT